MFDWQIASDLHKDAYGFRPSASTRDYWKSLDQAALDVIWHQMCIDLEQSIADEARAQRMAAERFEATISELLTLGAADRETAIRWLADANDCSSTDGVSTWTDLGFLEYKMGLCYGYIEHNRRV